MKTPAKRPLSERALWGRKPLWITILLVLSLLFSYLIIIHFAEGGDVTWFSMFFLFLIGYFYGGKTGLLCALAFSILKFLGDWAFGLLDTGHMKAEVLDYFFSYGLIGLGGFFSQPPQKKEITVAKASSPENTDKDTDVEDTAEVSDDDNNPDLDYFVGTWPEHRRLCLGYFIAMMFRFISSIVNFMMFYYRNERTFFGNLSEAFFYCVGYVGSEMMVTLLLLLILPWVRNSAEYCRFVATHEYPIDYKNY